MEDHFGQLVLNICNLPLRSESLTNPIFVALNIVSHPDSQYRSKVMIVPVYPFSTELPAITGKNKSKKTNLRELLTAEQHDVLMVELDKNAFPTKERRDRIASDLGIEPKTVQIWFQNQRQKCRRSVRNARAKQERQLREQMQKMSPMMSWCGIPVSACPPPTPKLSYDGPDRCAELNALVDAAVEELIELEREKSVHHSLKSITLYTKEPTKASSPTSSTASLLRAVPVSLLKGQSIKSNKSSPTTSPRLKTLQPRSQPNNESIHQVKP